jgi:hypothetical protein
VRVFQARVLDDHGRLCSQFAHGDDVTIEFVLEAQGPVQHQMCVVIIKTSAGVPVFHLLAHDGITHKPLYVPGNATVRCTIPKCGLYPGTYTVSLWIGSTPYQESDCRADALTFQMEQGALLDMGLDLEWRHGLVHADSRWQVEGSRATSQLSVSEDTWRPALT